MTYYMLFCCMVKAASMWMHVDSAIFCRLNRPNLRDQKFLVQAISILIFLGVTLDWEILSLDFLRGTPLESTGTNSILFLSLGLRP